MDWRAESIECLRSSPLQGYVVDGPIASEATALTCIALARHGLKAEAMAAARWLAKVQVSAGSVGVYADHEQPRWPTALACLAWKQCAGFAGGEFQEPLVRALDWTVTLRGKPVEDPLNQLGHDTSLVAWPWVEGTHSWIEPTAMHVLALKSNGRLNHPRTREALIMLRDRLLPSGGCNYGNTRVFEQLLPPHVQPTGLALLALSGEADIDGRIARSLDYLSDRLAHLPTASSLAWAVLGLAAHGPIPRGTEQGFVAVHRRLMRRNSAPYQRAYLLLADPTAPWSLQLNSDCGCGVRQPIAPPTPDAILGGAS